MCGRYIVSSIYSARDVISSRISLLIFQNVKIASMKKHLITTFFCLSLSWHASAQVRQSYFTLAGAFERLVESIFGNDQPYKDYVIDYGSDKELNFLDNKLLNIDIRHPNLEATFAFTNTNEAFEGVYKKDMGVCRGYSSLRRKFRYLSLFDKDNRAQIDVPKLDESKKSKRKFKKFYKQIVKDIRNYKPRVIPGFANLFELSQHPELSEMVKWQVLYEWRDKNFSPGTGTGDLIRGVFKHSSIEDLLQMRTRIENNVALGHNTMIWLSEKHSSWIHVLEAIDVTAIGEDGSFLVTFWNDKFIELERAKSYLTVKADGSLFYDDTIVKRELNAAGVTAENDGELKFFAEKLTTFCGAHEAHCK